MSKLVALKRLLVTPITDGPHETPEFHGSGVPFMSAESIKNGHLDFSLKRGYISESQHIEYIRKAKPQRDDIFMIKSGATTGKVAIVETDETFSIWSPLALIRANKELLDPRYLYYSLRSEFFQKQVENSWSFGTQQNIGMKVIENLGIYQHSLEVQARQVGFLDEKTATIDKMIAAKNRTRTHLAELRTAIISELIFGAKGLEDGSNQLYRHLISKQSGTWGLEPNGFNEVKCLRVADFDYDKLTHVEPETIRSIDSNHMATKLLRHGDILIEKSGGGEKAPVGRAIIVNELNGLTSYANFVDRLRFKKTVLPRYALYVLYAMYSGGINTKHIKQNTGIQNLDIKHYLKETVPIPSIQDQLSIIKHAQVRLSKLDATADLLNKTILQLKEYRTSLISNVITGKVGI